VSFGRALMIGASLVLAAGLSIALDVWLIVLSLEKPVEILVGAALFNGAAILQAAVGSIIELRRPGHRIGRIFLVGGPTYAGLAALWLTAERTIPLLGPDLAAIVAWLGVLLSYFGVGLIIAGIPLLFPTGHLPGPRWRVYAGIPGLAFGIGLIAVATKPGELGPGVRNPFALSWWPSLLEVFSSGIFVSLLALVAVGLAGQVVRYRRGNRTEQLQIRWFALSVLVVLVGFAAVIIEQGLRTTDGPLVTAPVAYAGILLMPVTIGIAVLRYRLYEIDRIISRTIGWALVSGILVAVFAGVVVALQTVLAGITQGETLAVAASTLVAFAIFQPVRRRVQSAVDRRFDRARYDAQRTVDTFAEHLRSEVDLGRLRSALVVTADRAVRPVGAAIWLRAGSER